MAVPWQCLGDRSRSLGLCVLYSIYFKDANKGYAVGKKGYALKTTDAGATWSVMVIAGLSNDLLKVVCTASLKCFVVGARGTLYTDNKDDSSWTNLNSDGSSIFPTNIYDDIHDIAFATTYSSEQGYAVGQNGMFYKTTDEGQTWAEDTVAKAALLTLAIETLHSTSMLDCVKGILLAIESL